MTFAGYLNSQFSAVQYLELFARIIAACICGACIGRERSRHNKEAGIKTHMVVCCGAALFMIISKYGFVDMADVNGDMLNGTRGADTARIAAQVVSGVSFLGVGVIYRHGSRVKGLTTAAGIWMTSAIGLAVGAGMYGIAIFGTLVISLLRIVIKKISPESDLYVTYKAKFSGCLSEDFQDYLIKKLDEGGQIVQTKVSRKGKDEVEYEMIINVHHEIDYREINRFANGKIKEGTLSHFLLIRI